MPLKKKSEVTQSCLTLCNPMDCNLPGSSVHGILQARVLEWVAIWGGNKQGPAACARRMQACPSLLKSELRAHSDNQPSLPASAVASLVTNRIQGHLGNSFWHPTGFNLWKMVSRRKKTRIVTLPPHSQNKHFCFRRTNSGEGVGSWLSRWQKTHLFSRISKWKIFQLCLPG